jgi:hypothetical protein
MASCGFAARVLPGMTFLTAIRPIRLVTDIFSDGIFPGFGIKCYGKWLKI